MTHLERIEHVAEVFWRAKMMGKVNRIREIDIAKLMNIRSKLMGAG